MYHVLAATVTLMCRADRETNRAFRCSLPVVFNRIRVVEIIEKHCNENNYDSEDPGRVSKDGVQQFHNRHCQEQWLHCWDTSWLLHVHRQCSLCFVDRLRGGNSKDRQTQRLTARCTPILLFECFIYLVGFRIR